MKLFVCADCGHEQDQMFLPCEKCGKPRVITIKAAERMGGPNWRKAFTPEGIPENELPPGVTYTTKPPTDEVWIITREGRTLWAAETLQTAKDCIDLTWDNNRYTKEFKESGRIVLVAITDTLSPDDTRKKQHIVNLMIQPRPLYKSPNPLPSQ